MVTADSVSPRLDRRLGVFEELLWLTDLATPRHFAYTARIRGSLDREAVELALLRVQRRHPALCVRIALDEDQYPAFGPEPAAQIPLTVRERTGEQQWQDEVESELARPFTADDAPLMRCVLLLGSPLSEVILLVHHAIGDGLSTTYLVRDLLQSLAGRPEQTTLPARPSLEALLGLGTSPAPLPPSSERPRSDLSRVLASWVIGHQSVDALVERCRREGTTVQGALIAAVTLALREAGMTGDDGYVRCNSPISVRHLCPPINDDFGLYLAAAKTSHGPDESTDMWDIARAAHDQVTAGLERTNLAARAGGQRQLLLRCPTPAAAYQAFRNLVDYQVVITNVGRFPAEADYGDIRLEALWGIPNAEKEPVIGVATVDAGMCVALISDGSPLAVVEDALGRLRALDNV